MKNWRTTLFGGLFAAASVIAANPASIDFLGDPQAIRTVAGIAALITGATAFYHAQDKTSPPAV